MEVTMLVHVSQSLQRLKTAVAYFGSEKSFSFPFIKLVKMILLPKEIQERITRMNVNQ
jgi:hypothetical protein